MDRLPKKAPFRIGTKLRYVGKHHSYTYDIDPVTKERKEVPLQVPGMIVTVEKEGRGWRGTLRHMQDENGPMYYEDTGEPILDETHDAYSVYYVEAYQGGCKQGRCIHVEDKKEWEVVR